MWWEDKLGVIWLKNKDYKVIVARDISCEDCYSVYTLIGKKRRRILSFRYEEDTLQVNLPTGKYNYISNAVIFMLYHLYKPKILKINEKVLNVIKENYDILFYANREHYRRILSELKSSDNLDKIILIKTDAIDILSAEN